MKSVQQVAYRRDPDIRGIEICEVNQSRHVFPDHAHDGIYAIGMMLAGGAYCLGAEKSYSLVSPGQIALINPNQVHSGVPVPGRRISYRMIYVDMPSMTTTAAEVARRPLAIPEFTCMVVGDPTLWHLLEQHSESAVHVALRGRQVQSGSLAGVQVGPQQPSARPHPGQVLSHEAAHVPPPLQLSTVQVSLSLQSALVPHSMVVHSPPQHRPPLQEVSSGSGSLLQ